MLLSYSARRRGMYAVSAIDLCSRAFGDAYLLAIRLNLETHAGRLAVLADDRDVGQVDRRLLRDDAALLRLGLLLVTLDHVDAADQRLVVVGTHLEHLAGTALVAAVQHDDLVALPDLGSHHSTSGASEMIFMWFLARSSRGTGPKMREPSGSDSLLISPAPLRLIVDQHGGVAGEADDGAVGAADVLADPHHDRLHDVALLHLAARNCLLDRHDNNVAHGGIAALGAPKHLDTHDTACAGIVGHVEVGLHLNH